MRARTAYVIVLCAALFALFAPPASAHEEDSKSTKETKEEKAEQEAQEKEAEEEAKAAEEEKKAEEKEKEEAKKEAEKSKGDCRTYFFRYDDSHTDSGTFCDGNDVTRSEKPGLHAVSLHISCSDEFPNGIPEKSDIGNHDRVTKWSISDADTGEILCGDSTSSSDEDKSSAEKSSDDEKSSKSGDCRGYRFVYDDGHVDEGVFCGGNDVTRSEKPGLHAVTLHISCSDQFPNGIPEKSDIGDHERVTDWMIYDSETGEILCPDDAVEAQTTQQEEPCDDDPSMPGTQPCVDDAPCDADATMPGTQPCLDEEPCDADASMPGTQPCLTDEEPCDADATMPGTQPCEEVEPCDADPLMPGTQPCAEAGDDVLGERFNNGPNPPAAAPQDDVAATGQNAGAELPFTGAPLSAYFVASLALMSGGIAVLRAKRKRQTT